MSKYFNTSRKYIPSCLKILRLIFLTYQIDRFCEECIICMFMTQHGIWHLIRCSIFVCFLLFSYVPIYYVEPLEIALFYK